MTHSALWPPPNGPEATYRLTYIPAFSGPTGITLSVSADGKVRVAIKTLDRERELTKVDETALASRDQLDRLFTLLEQAHFWTAPAELPRTGLDGTEWIMEGVTDGKYRIVVGGAPTWNASPPKRFRLQMQAVCCSRLRGTSGVGVAELGASCSWRYSDYHALTAPSRACESVTALHPTPIRGEDEDRNSFLPYLTEQQKQGRRSGDPHKRTLGHYCRRDPWERWSV